MAGLLHRIDEEKIHLLCSYESIWFNPFIYSTITRCTFCCSFARCHWTFSVSLCETTKNGIWLLNWNSFARSFTMHWTWMRQWRHHSAATSAMCRRAVNRTSKPPSAYSYDNVLLSCALSKKNTINIALDPLICVAAGAPRYCMVCGRVCFCRDWDEQRERMSIL